MNIRKRIWTRGDPKYLELEKGSKGESAPSDFDNDEESETEFCPVLSSVIN